MDRRDAKQPWDPPSVQLSKYGETLPGTRQGSAAMIFARFAFCVAGVLSVQSLASVLGCASGADCAEGESCSDDSGDTNNEDSWPPDACSLIRSPFLQPECLGAMRLACDLHGEENVCTAVPGLSFDGGAYEVRCLWAKVVSFSDVDTCAVEAVVGRCEASLDGLPCGDLCAGESQVSNVSAIPSESEIVQLCGGPLGSWTAVGSTEMYGFTCGDNLDPPPPPLCDCVEAACEAS